MMRAKLGVPANATRAEPRSGLGAMALLHSLANPLAFQRRDVVDEQLPFEVVAFMLYTLREQTLGVEFEFRALKVQGVDSNTVSARDGFIKSRNGKATLGCLLVTRKVR